MSEREVREIATRDSDKYSVVGAEISASSGVPSVMSIEGQASRTNLILKNLDSTESRNILI